MDSDIKSYRAIFRHWCETSSIKCLPKIVKAQTNGRKLLWILALLLGSTYSSYCLYGLVRLFLEYPVSVNIEIMYGDVPYPDITVCNLNYGWISKPQNGMTAKIKGIQQEMTYDEYMRFIANLTEAEQTDESSNTDYLWEDAYHVTGFIRESIATSFNLSSLHDVFVVDCFGSTYQLEQIDCSIKVYLSALNGLCFTLTVENHGSKEALSTDELSDVTVILFMNDLHPHMMERFDPLFISPYGSGVKLSLHTWGTVPDMANGFIVEPGREAVISTSLTQTDRIGEPYEACDRADDLEIFTGMDGANDEWNYSIDACHELCIQSSILEQCGCIDLYYLTFSLLRGNNRFCGQLDVHNMTEYTEDMECIYSIEYDICYTKCLVQCEEREYSYTVNQVRKKIRISTYIKGKVMMLLLLQW